MSKSGEDEVWVPITINLPLGLAKQWTPANCAPMSLLCGPFAIIFLAQTANTVLVPVLPFLVKDVGAGAVEYGILQSTLWTSQTILAPVLGWLSDKIGRKPVIRLSLVISAIGNALLAISFSVKFMFVARIVSGLGFQIALFRAYFADKAAKKDRAGKFGLIGFVQGFSLFGGPALGGAVSAIGGKRMAAWLAAGMNLAGAFIALIWREDPSEADAGGGGKKTLSRTESTKGMSELELAKHNETHKTVNGVKMVKIDLGKVPEADGTQSEGMTSPTGSDGQDDRTCLGLPTNNPVCRFFRKAYKLAIWMAKHDLYPLLSLNFVFRFAFAAYKSVFAFFCMAQMGYKAKEVGFLLSMMGVMGMFVQGVLVRVTVAKMGEERTLALSMASTCLGFGVLSIANSLQILIPALALIAVGYGLAVPCLTTLFAGIPVEQGIMQGIAGAIDRFGQAFGPIVGGYFLKLVGEAALMRYTGLGLAVMSSICMMFIGDGCLSWFSASLIESKGYAQVSVEPEQMYDEEEENEHVPLTKGGSHEMNGMNGDGKVEPVKPKIANGVH